MSAFDIDVTARDRERDVRLQLRDAGPFALVVGDPGAGKTALVETIAGLRRPRAGHVRVAGRLLTDADGGRHVRPARRGVGYVPAGGGLFPHLTVEENLAIGVRRVDAPAIEALEAAVARWSLRGLLGAGPDALTPARCVEVAVARALGAGATWLLLDGPDRATGASGWTAFLDAIADLGHPAIVACEAAAAAMARPAWSRHPIDARPPEGP